MTEHRIDPRMTINEILLDHPAAVSVLNGFGIDTCCGGGSSLAEAAEENGIELEALLTELDRELVRAAEVS